MDLQITPIHLKVPGYLVKGRDGYVLIDTGDASDLLNLEKALDRAGVTAENLRLVLLTHGDFDHAGNAAALQKKYGVKIAMHPADWGMVEHADMGWNRKARPDRVTSFGRVIMIIARLFTSKAIFIPFKPDLAVEDGFDLSVYGIDARVIDLPGHSKGSIGVLTASHDLFSGDLLMAMFQPDLHFMIDDLASFHASLKKLSEVGVRTVYPGHGKPFLMERFIKTHPALLN